MPYIVRLRKLDGCTINLPETYPDPIPCDGSVIVIPFGGGTTHAKVEKSSQIHSASPSGTIDTVRIIYATQTQWTDGKVAEPDDE
jgi:hypothetical protein